MNEIEELFPFYALGALSLEEKAQVEAYVAKDSTAKVRLEEMIATARAIPFETVPTPPSKATKTALMARVRADQAKNQATVALPEKQNWLQVLRSWLVSPVFSATAMAIIVLMGVWISNLQVNVAHLTSENNDLQGTVTSLSDTNGELQTHLTDLEQENNLLREAILDDEELIALFTNPDRQEIPVVGTDHQPDAQGTLLVGAEEDTRAVLIVSNLPSLPAGMVYQFWLIGDGTPIGAGLFHSNAQGHGVLVVNSEEVPVMDFDAIGVSIEPVGGSEQPTGNIVLLGNL